MKRIQPIALLPILLLSLTLNVHASLSTIQLEGRVALDSQNFTGVGEFKFAIVTGEGAEETTLWSNDGSSANGREPAAAVLVNVNQGVFTVPLGDTTRMDPIDPAVLLGHQPRVRVWFRDEETSASLQLELHLDAVIFALVASTVDDDAITEPKILDLAVNTPHFKNDAVTTEELDDSAVTTEKLDDGAVTSSKLALSTPPPVRTIHIQDGQVKEEDLAANSVSSSKIIDNSVQTHHIINLQVTSAKLATGAVTTDRIVNANVTEDKLATGAVRSHHFDGGAVTESKLKDQSVTAEKIGGDAVATNHFRADSVSEPKLQDGAVRVRHLGEGQVDGVHIEAGEVTNVNLAAGAVTAPKLGPVANREIAPDAAIAPEKLAPIVSVGKVENAATTATEMNDLSTIVLRDESGDFEAGTTAADLDGAASENLLRAGGAMSGGLVAPRFISAAEDGTAPFAVDSTTMVPNLNVEFLDGHRAEDLVNSNFPVVWPNSMTFDEITTAERLTTSGEPGSNAVDGGSFLIAPAFAAAGDTLLGVAVNNATVARVDSEGNLAIIGILAVNGAEDMSQAFIHNPSALKVDGNIAFPGMLEYSENLIGGFATFDIWGTNPVQTRMLRLHSRWTELPQFPHMDTRISTIMGSSSMDSDWGAGDSTDAPAIYGFGNHGASVSVIRGGTGNHSSGTILGGLNNRTASESVVLGGEDNTGWHQSMDYDFHPYFRGGVVPGGVNNLALDGAFAAGAWTFAAPGSFLFNCYAYQNDHPPSHGSNKPLSNINPDQGWQWWMYEDGGLPEEIEPRLEFIAKVRGGARLYSHEDLIGVRLTSNSWTSTSDKNFKENRREIEPGRTLAALLATPVSTWNYRTQDSSIRHMGVMAQDFHAAFGLDDSPRHISNVDASGVLMKSIQDLNREIEDRSARLSVTIDEQDEIFEQIEQQVKRLQRTEAFTTN